ncbi:MAG: hypothetical protein ACLR2O_14525 [Coprococcus sp.]
MLDIKFVRQNPDVVKENIRKNFRMKSFHLVDEVIELDKRNREIKGEVEALRAEKNKVSKEIGACMAHGEKEKKQKSLRKSSGKRCHVWKNFLLKKKKLKQKSKKI